MLPCEIEELIRMSDWRAFLKKALQFQYKDKASVNLSDFSRRAGFSSRGFLADVLSGKKNISSSSLIKIKRGLKVNSSFKEYFQLLVYKDLPHLIDVESKKRRSIDDQIKELRNKINSQQQHIIPPKDKLLTLVKSPLFFQIFAALGSFEDGASLNRVLELTNIEKVYVVKALKIMESHKIIESKNGKFYALTDSLKILGIDYSEGMEDLIKDVCVDISYKRNKILSSKENILFYSAFSVNRADHRKINKKIQSAIHEIMSEFQIDDGDSIKQIFLAGYKC